MYFPLAYLSQYFFGPLLFLISLFIVLIILLQRGRGGGLTGALGGAGGASAFGVKAGDIFTRITAVAVLIWIVLCAVTCYWYLPEKLNIATTPSSSSSSSATGMGGIGGLGLDGDISGPGPIDGAAPSVPVETPDPSKTNNSIDLPAGVTSPAAAGANSGSTTPIPVNSQSTLELPSALSPQAIEVNTDSAVPKP